MIIQINNWLHSHPLSQLHSQLHSQQRPHNLVINCAVVFILLTANAAHAVPDGAIAVQENLTLPLAVQDEDVDLPLTPASPVIEDERSDAIKVLINNIRFQGVRVFSLHILEELVSDELGQMHSFVGLRRIAAQVLGTYQEAGYIMAQVYLPVQNVNSGTLQINVNEGFIDEINIEQQGNLKNKKTAQYLTSLKGNAVNSTTLERKIRLLSDLPSNDISIVFQPSLKEGYTDMTVTTTDVQATKGYLSLDNHGNRYLGSSRISGQYNLNNTLGYGEQISFNTASSGRGYHHLAIDSQFPIGGDGLSLNNTLSYTDYQLGETFSALEAHGHSNTFSAQLFYPLIRSLEKNTYIAAELKHQKFNDKVDLINSSTDKKVESLRVNLSGDFITFSGARTRWDLGINAGYVSLDTDQQNTDNYGIHGKYSFLTANVNYQHRFNDKWTLQLNSLFQFAQSNLDSALKMQLGGSNGVRAYPQGEALVDTGAIVNLDFIYQKSDQLRLGFFWDTGFGDAHKHKQLTDTNNAKYISGMGLRADWDIARNWRLNSTMSWRTDSEPESDTKDLKPRIWLQLVKYF